ncbi:polysaccharide pyruvyl transferase family protein [Altererythrobacter arenosus]|uniref:Polysaccharide pyruvyl transferase family protein n=1 Tax=Altererythrobacter arenosus TaxID=3032592 RepID=A0ABY8FY82_9SPHN|nr:polysaccharide pyruvyl transferase family protein [Altererythrobacter sp. CAU 1644]WFL78331.1 polysaccharide pyruvyl transferase family protein [Altererythrobacter sp. CAU 1644]
MDRIAEHYFEIDDTPGSEQPGVDDGPLRDQAPIPIAVFNVKYSPNLGDGVIAECLEHSLRTAEPSLRPYSIDLAGRESFDASNGGRRRWLISALETLPSGVRRYAVPLALRALVGIRLARRWREQLRGAKAVVVGGGNLFADRDQNFPIKISSALELARDLRLPVAIAAIGVGKEWSKAGRSRLTRAISRSRVVSISVRDGISQHHWQEYLSASGTDRVPIALDPGLLAARVYGTDDKADRADTIGICLTAPEVLRLHGQHGADRCDLEWMVEFVSALLGQDHRLVLFTNGSPEDQHFLDLVYARLPKDPRLSRADRFTKPRDLARFIGSLQGVVAHRLHACIVAHSYGVPTAGLVWDAKLEGFFTTIGRAPHLIDPSMLGPFEAARMSIDTMSAIPDPTEVAALQDDCFGSIADLAGLVNTQAVAA